MALTALFFYGTLRHLPLLETLLGRSRGQMRVSEAHLPDHAVFWVADQPFPMIAAEPGAQAQGVLVHDLGTEDLARVAYYEGGFDYDLRDVTVQTATGPVTAQVFFPQPGAWAPSVPWSLADWERDWAALSCQAADEAMTHYGEWSPAELAVRLPMIRRRVWARLAAQARGPSQDHRDGADAVQVLAHDRPFTGFFAMQRMDLTHPLYAGGHSPPLDRELFFVGDAATVLPYDPVRDMVVLTEQFRPNVFANGDPSPWVIEPVSGLVDPGESPETAAIREAREEAGLQVTQLELVGRSYSSTGSSTEFVHMYVGLADIDLRGEGGGVVSEGEDIRVLTLGFETFRKGLETHRFRDTPLLTTGLWLVLNRDRLRAAS